MTDISGPLSKADAMAFYDFLHQRLFGWNISISSNNPRGMIDGRCKSAKIGDRLLKDVFLNGPHWREFVAFAMDGRDPISLWPEQMQEFVRFCLNHRCLREINEPLSVGGLEKRTMCQGMPAWPEFLNRYDNTATLADMPTLPPASEIYRAMEARRRA
jgi:hypothetical protein